MVYVAEDGGCVVMVAKEGVPVWHSQHWPTHPPVALAIANATSVTSKMFVQFWDEDLSL